MMATMTCDASSMNLGSSRHSSSSHSFYIPLSSFSSIPLLDNLSSFSLLLQSLLLFLHEPLLLAPFLIREPFLHPLLICPSSTPRTRGHEINDPRSPYSLPNPSQRFLILPRQSPATFWSSPSYLAASLIFLYAVDPSYLAPALPLCFF